MENFENKLIEMTKPEILDLRHQDLLSKEILRSKDKSVLSWWWLSPPLFIIAALIMKTQFNPGTTFYSNFHEIADSRIPESLFAFIILPLFFIILNFLSIKKIYDLAGKPGGIDLFEITWYNVFIISVCIFIITIYLL